MNSKNYTTFISSKHRLLDLQLRETLRYRDLIRLFVKRDFAAGYRQTLLGPLWAVLQPLLTTVVFTLVFGRLAGLTTADAPGAPPVPGFLFYLAGTSCWSYFSAVLQQTSNTFVQNRHILGKVYYPRLVMPVSAALSRLVGFGIQLAFLLALWARALLTGEAAGFVTPRLLLLPLCVLQLMCLAVGCGIILSSLTVKYRDLAMLVGFGLQLWQYASPVAYGLELVPESYRSLFLLNPVTPALTSFRYALFGGGYFELPVYLCGWAFTLLILLAGLMLFSKTQRSFTDTV